MSNEPSQKWPRENSQLHLAFGEISRHGLMIGNWEVISHWVPYNHVSAKSKLSLVYFSPSSSYLFLILHVIYYFLQTPVICGNRICRLHLWRGVRSPLPMSVLYMTINHWEFTPGGCPRGVMVKAMDCAIVVSEFVLQWRYYVRFRANTLGKGMNPLILPAMG